MESYKLKKTCHITLLFVLNFCLVCWFCRKILLNQLLGHFSSSHFSKCQLNLIAVCFYSVKAQFVSSIYYKDWQVIMWIKPNVRHRERLRLWPNGESVLHLNAFRLKNVETLGPIKQNIPADFIDAQATDLGFTVQRYLKLLQDKTSTKLIWGYRGIMWF